MSESTYTKTDIDFMKMAYAEACLAGENGEIPVGAVVVCQDRVIAKGHNQTVLLNDSTAHAEIIALTAAENYLNSRYLNTCDIYVTLEPCVMCAGAFFWAQFRKIVYAADDDKQGYSRIKQNLLHPKTKVVKGVLKDPCEKLLKDFFLKLRQ